LPPPQGISFPGVGDSLVARGIKRFSLAAAALLRGYVSEPGMEMLGIVPVSEIGVPGSGMID